MKNLDRLLEKSREIRENQKQFLADTWVLSFHSEESLMEQMLAIAVKALESCIKRIEGDHKSHCWRMDKEYLTEEYVKNDSHLRGLKETLSKIEALAAKALGDSE